MQRFKQFHGAIVSSLLFMTSSLVATASETPRGPMQSVIASDGAWRPREFAFAQLRDAFNKTPGDEIIREKLIDLLRTEVTAAKSDASLKPEEYSDYLGSLVECVVQTGDVRALALYMDPALLNTGNMVTRAIASFGDRAVGRVVNALNSAKDDETRHSLTLTIVHFMELQSVRNPANIAMLEDQLIAELRAREFLIRIAAVDGLAHFDDATASQALFAESRMDPYVVRVKGKLKYPVREEASALLEHAR